VLVSCTLEINTCGFINIESGGVLKLINSVVTTKLKPNLWKGINVVGNPAYPQVTSTLVEYNFFNGSQNYYSMSHGSLWLIQSTISYAEKAVYSMSGNGGGYCNIDQRTFRDNDYSVYLENYPGFDQNSQVLNSTFDNPNRLAGWVSGIYYPQVYIKSASRLGGNNNFLI